MGSKKYQTTGPEAINTTENDDTKLQEKHMRKLEETNDEIVTESKKDLKKKKNKERREEEAETINVLKVILVNKKKKGKEDGEKEILNNGSDEKSKKKTDNDRTEKTIQEVRESSCVVVSWNNVNDLKYKELNSFAESGLPSEVLECCKNFDKPSPIQSQSWAFLLEGRDFIGIAKTGSDNPFIVLFLSLQYGILCNTRIVYTSFFRKPIVCMNRQNTCFWNSCYHARFKQEKEQNL